MKALRSFFLAKGTAMNVIAYLCLGLVAGIFSGILGLGGGIILIPAMVFLFGMTQPQAQGTTLALMVPPIGLLAAWAYYKQGLVDLKMAAFICLGFFVGGLLGANVAFGIPEPILKKVFGTVLLLISLQMILGK
jgi:uncharacterized membrane protein YfcA